MNVNNDYYTKLFSKLNDQGLIQCFNNQVSIEAWTSSRASYLAALHLEFENRGFDYSEIGSKSMISLKNKIRLTGNKIRIVWEN